MDTNDKSAAQKDSTGFTKPGEQKANPSTPQAPKVQDPSKSPSDAPKKDVPGQKV
ncbi:MAG: hypothetical protein ACXVA9_08255 [Bdellovibrionales bacterium]